MLGTGISLMSTEVLSKLPPGKFVREEVLCIDGLYQSAVVWEVADTRQQKYFSVRTGECLDTVPQQDEPNKEKWSIIGLQEALTGSEEMAALIGALIIDDQPSFIKKVRELTGANLFSVKIFADNIWKAFEEKRKVYKEGLLHTPHRELRNQIVQGVHNIFDNYR